MKHVDTTPENPIALLGSITVYARSMREFENSYRRVRLLLDDNFARKHRARLREFARRRRYPFGRRK